MNASEGLRRIATVIRWIGIGFAGVSLAIGVLMGASELYEHVTCTDGPWTGYGGTGCRPRLGDAAGAALLGAGFAAFFYFGARATAWIVDGFAAPR